MALTRCEDERLGLFLSRSKVFLFINFHMQVTSSSGISLNRRKDPCSARQRIGKPGFPRGNSQWIFFESSKSVGQPVE